MPYRSKSQMRKFFAMESRGELPKGTAKEWAHETKSIESLPEHAKKEVMTQKTSSHTLGNTLMKIAAVSEEEAKQYGAFRSQTLAGVPRAEAMLAAARKVKAEHPAQYYLNPLVPGPITHALATVGRRASATVANAPIRSGLAVGGLAAAGGLAGQAIGGQGGYGMDSSASAMLGQLYGQLGGVAAGTGLLAAIGNKKRQEHARELYKKVVQKYED